MFGFTRREVGILLFLSFSFLVGLGFKFYRMYWEPLPEIAELEIQLSEKTMIIDSVRTLIDKEKFNTRIVRLNNATREELESINGIGPVLAERILSYREEKGAFKSIEELNKVQGIGEKSIEKIKDQLILN
jgi:comEA protein